MSIASTDDFADLASVKSDSIYSGEALEELRSTIEKLAIDMEHMKSREGNDSVEKLKVKNAELEATIQKLTEENEKLKGGVKKDEEDILTSIIGSWQMVSSTGMEEYAKNGSKFCQSGLWLTVFETGLPNFSYDEQNEKLTVFFTVGSQEFLKKTVKLGEKCVVNEVRQATFVEENSLVTVRFHHADSCEEYARVERYLKDGQLHIVSKRFGIRCTRIYEKVGRERQMEQCEVEVLRKRIAELEAQENEKVEWLRQQNKELEAQIISLASQMEAFDNLLKQEKGKVLQVQMDNYRATESTKVKKLQNRIAELEEEFAQQEDALEQQLETAQKDNETISEQLKQAIQKAAENPEKFKDKVLGRWSAMDGSDYLHFIVKNGLLTLRREHKRDETLYPASNQDIWSAFARSRFSYQYSDTMAFIYDMHSRKFLYFFIEGRLVACNLTQGNQCQYYTKTY